MTYLEHLSATVRSVGLLGRGLLGRGLLAAGPVGMLSLAGCGEYRPSVTFIHDGQSELGGLEVTCSSWEELGGRAAFELSITNTTSAGVSDLQVILNDEYRCELAALSVSGGFFAGSAPLGRSTLRPNETLQFQVSHDTTNGSIVRNAAQQPLPDDLVLSSVGLEAAGPSGRWVRSED